MRSSNGGWHGLAGWGFRGLSEAGAWLRANDGGNPLSAAGSPLAAANLHVAGLRSVSELPGAKGLPVLLAAEGVKTAVRGQGRSVQADQTSRTPRRRRRVP